MPKKKKKSSIEKNKYLIISAVLLAVIMIALAVNIEKLKGIEVPFTPKTAAIVNGEEITNEELNTRYEFFFYITGYPEQYKSQITKEDVLDNMIDETILLQEARKNNINIQKSDVEKGVEEVAQISGMSIAELEINLVESGFSISYLQNYYKNQLEIAELLNKTIAPKIIVTEQEIQEYYNNHQEEYIGKQGEIRARHILVETEKEAEEIYQALQSTSLAEQKEKFKETAKQRSTCPSASRGGDLGFFSKGAMVPEFEDAAFSLSVNEISKPIKTQFGWHIIMKEGNQIYLHEAKEEIEATIREEKQSQDVKGYVKLLRENAEIDIRSDKQTITGASCYEEYSLAPETIIFYHTQGCPHCQKMMPIVKGLEQEGYTFYWADALTEESAVVKECYQDVLQGGVPEFICAGNKEFLIGATTKEKLKEFADNCIKDH